MFCLVFVYASESGEDGEGTAKQAGAVYRRINAVCVCVYLCACMRVCGNVGGNKTGGCRRGARQP